MKTTVICPGVVIQISCKRYAYAHASSPRHMSHRLLAYCMGSVGTLSRRWKSEFKINLRFYSNDGSNVCVCVGACGIEKVSHRTIYGYGCRLSIYCFVWGEKIWQINQKTIYRRSSVKTVTNLSSNV